MLPHCFFCCTIYVNSLSFELISWTVTVFFATVCGKRNGLNVFCWKKQWSYKNTLEFCHKTWRIIWIWINHSINLNSFFFKYFDPLVNWCTCKPTINWQVWAPLCTFNLSGFRCWVLNVFSSNNPTDRWTFAWKLTCTCPLFLFFSLFLFFFQKTQKQKTIAVVDFSWTHPWLAGRPPVLPSELTSPSDH